MEIKKNINCNSYWIIFWFLWLCYKSLKNKKNNQDPLKRFLRDLKFWLRVLYFWASSSLLQIYWSIGKASLKHETPLSRTFLLRFAFSSISWHSSSGEQNTRTVFNSVIYYYYSIVIIINWMMKFLPRKRQKDLKVWLVAAWAAVLTAWFPFSKASQQVVRIAIIKRPFIVQYDEHATCSSTCQYWTCS